jgi:hypothetical protein
MSAFKYRITGSYRGQHMATSYTASLIRALAISMSYARHGWKVTIN